MICACRSHLHSSAPYVIEGVCRALFHLYICIVCASSLHICIIVCYWCIHITLLFFCACILNYQRSVPKCIVGAFWSLQYRSAMQTIICACRSCVFLSAPQPIKGACRSHCYLSVPQPIICACCLHHYISAPNLNMGAYRSQPIVSVTQSIGDCRLYSQVYHRL